MITVTVRRPRSWMVGHSLLRSDLSVTSRHEFVEARNLVVGDAATNVGEPGKPDHGPKEATPPSVSD